MASDGTIRAEALDWAVRTGDPSFADWDAFVLWLEADPAHALAYDAVSASVSDAADLIAKAGPANDDGPAAEPVRHRRPAWLAGGLAALTLVAGISTFFAAQRDLYLVETPPGETRTVALESGTRVELAGGTTIAFDRDDARYARLDHGQALFTVRHDAERPFEVNVGEERLVDLGTVFDVSSDASGLKVAVAEGAVSFDPEGAAVRIGPGQALRRPAGSNELVLVDVPPQEVGEWRDGRLTFEATPLDEVAARLTRATGVVYAAAPGGALVSGSILTASLREDPAAIGPLLGVAVRREGGRWVIGGR
ncbi:FecR domain-containing protein [Novosphingobium sp. RD2P27]|uniref:FecR domain-containing protein n=1 Tax=Novosphingobium kalidii TaxID=3230299 RepID=A0ABV2CWM6_9SPHN